MWTYYMISHYYFYILNTVLITDDKCLEGRIYVCYSGNHGSRKSSYNWRFAVSGFLSWPRVHKAFQNQDQGQAQVKKSSTMDFF